MKRILAILAAAVMLLSCTACSSDGSGEYPVTLANITVSEKPASVICLSDSVADILISCGYSELITARSDECDQPEISSAFSVGSKDDPSVQNITDLDPDIVFADKTISDDAYKKLTDSGLTVIIMMPAKNTEELMALYENVCSVAGGKITGKQNGSEKSNSLLVTMSDLQRIVPKSDIVVTACYLYDLNGSAATDNTLEGKLFEYANAVNVFASSASSPDMISKLRLSDPDYIFCASGVKTQLEKNTDLRSLKAVKTGNVFEIDSNAFRRQGSSLVDNLSFMIEKMNPQLNDQKPLYPETSSAEVSKAESSKQESSQQESSQAEGSQQESSQEESSQQESSQQESSQQESSQEESSSQVSADYSLTITDGTAYGYNESGDNILRIQQRLAYLDYFNTDATGYYGDMTVMAVIAFESANGLTIDGYASTSDLRLMFSSDARPAS